MNIVIFAHPYFLASISMPKYAQMLADAYRERGHQVQIWAPQARVYNWVPEGRFSKWAGYIDQFVLFPRWVKKVLTRQPVDTLYVFADQALGPWVPLVKSRPHVVHCHDFTALRSALGHFPENPISATGKIYQRYIRRGFEQARNFISVSAKTRDDLHDPGIGRVGRAGVISEVVYNGLNYPYSPMSPDEARHVLNNAGLPFPERGCVLHVGGNPWYKNKVGVVSLYAAYARQVHDPLPLWLVGPPLSGAAEEAVKKIPPQGQIKRFQGLDNEVLRALYSVANVMLFPSIAEGFGWPIVEAQACGCLVITTGEAPMTEVGGPVTRYLPRLKIDDDLDHWAQSGAVELHNLLARLTTDRQALAEQARAWTERFNSEAAIDGYLRVYQQIQQAGLQGQG